MALNDYKRAVNVRRMFVQKKLSNTSALNELAWEHYNYEKVAGQCCENVIGYVGLPVGIAGPLLLDNEEYTLPMATTEGTLVASTNRVICGAVMAGELSLMSA